MKDKREHCGDATTNYIYDCVVCRKSLFGERIICPSACPMCGRTDAEANFDSCLRAKVIIAGEKILFCLPEMKCECGHKFYCRIRVSVRRGCHANCKNKIDMTMRARTKTGCARSRTITRFKGCIS